ncbi:DUF4040 domain-containing protein [Elusimicrobiota bacterium]
MIDFILLFFLVVCAAVAVRMRDLLGSAMMLGAYSLIMAIVWTRFNAVDVAFTEAAVGAGITTVLLIAVLGRTKRWEDVRYKLSNVVGRRDPKYKMPVIRYKRRYVGYERLHSLVALATVALTGAALIYGLSDAPGFGDPDAPANFHVAPRYIESSHHDTGVGNFVTAILASYRGYDTLGETTVIFTAGMCVILLLRKRK